MITELCLLLSINFQTRFCVIIFFTNSNNQFGQNSLEKLSPSDWFHQSRILFLSSKIFLFSRKIIGSNVLINNFFLLLIDLISRKSFGQLEKIIKFDDWSFRERLNRKIIFLKNTNHFISFPPKSTFDSLLI